MFRFASPLFFSLTVVLFAITQSAWTNAAEPIVRSATSVAYDESSTHFPCWSAEEDALKAARNKCADSGFDGLSTQIGDGEVLASGMLVRENSAHLPWLEHGYRSFCKSRVYVKCAKEVQPVVNNTPRCYVTHYRINGFFGPKTYWSVNRITNGFRQTIESRHKSYLSAWNSALKLQSAIGCTLVPGYPN